MNLAFTYPWVFLLLPLAILPWLSRGQDTIKIPSLWLMEDKYVSRWFEIFLKLSISLLIVALIMAIATPFQPEQTIERTGQGAEIILLLDRSRSMDQPFYKKEYRNIPAGARPGVLSKRDCCEKPVIRVCCGQRK